MELPRVIEALLFASDRPLTLKAITLVLQQAGKQIPGLVTSEFEKMGAAEVEKAIAQLENALRDTASSLTVQAIAGGYQLKTRPEFAAWTHRLFETPRSPKLSQPALETLAVIAYRQPISRAEIEAVRGVAVDGVVAVLLERKIVRLAGRAEQAGRPLLYETTPLFLELFGLKDLAGLPNADELRRLPPALNPPHAQPTSEQLVHHLLAPTAPTAPAGGDDRSENPATLAPAHEDLHAHR